MVSGVSEVQSYKSNKGYYSAPSSHPSSNPSSAKRFSDGALRPWPPMYRSSSRSNLLHHQSNYQALSTSSASAKLNFNNLNGHYNNSNNAIYNRNKLNFHHLNMAPALNGKYASSMNLSNLKNAKNYYLVSQPYMKNSFILSNGNGAFYGRTADINNNNSNNNNINNNNNNNSNLIMADKDLYYQQSHEKNRFRKLRNPTQTPPYRSSCMCTRSKSMEDVRAEIITDWPSYNKDNYIEFKKNRIYGSALGGKHSTRRSMDNLLEVDTANFSKRFQV